MGAPPPEAINQPRQVSHRLTVRGNAERSAKAVDLGGPRVRHHQPCRQEVELRPTWIQQLHEAGRIRVLVYHPHECGRRRALPRQD
eukprot:7389604-Prymnesium_polylepis.2